MYEIVEKSHLSTLDRFSYENCFVFLYSRNLFLILHVKLELETEDSLNS